MERKEFNSLNEAALQVQRQTHVEYDEVDSMVLEYFENYFGDNLNEDTSDEDIMNAVYDLIDLTEAVLKFVEEESEAETDARTQEVLQIYNDNQNQQQAETDAKKKEQQDLAQKYDRDQQLRRERGGGAPSRIVFDLRKPKKTK